MLDPLYNLVARGIVVFHDGLAPVFGRDNFLSYALAIVLIVMLVRLLIVPLFVRSVKAQRTMQMLQPHIKEIREKYKNDRQMMNQKIMELQKEHGNPLLGCLPLLLQIPLFFALFHVFNRIQPREDMLAPGGYIYKATSGLTVEEVTSIAEAKLGGISLAGAFTSSAGELDFIGLSGVAVKITCVVLIITMSLTTFITQKQIMARNGPADPQQQMIQKVLLYASPIFLAVFGFNFPIAVLIYWMTTNLWSMGQQHFIIKRMPPLNIGGKGPPAQAAATSSGGGLTSLLKGKQAPPPEPEGPTRLTQIRQPPSGKGGKQPSDTGPESGDGIAGATGGTSAGKASGGGASGGGSAGARNVKPAKAASRPSGRPNAKKRTGKGGSRRGGRR